MRQLLDLRYEQKEDALTPGVRMGIFETKPEKGETFSRVCEKFGKPEDIVWQEYDDIAALNSQTHLTVLGLETLLSEANCGKAAKQDVYSEYLEKAGARCTKHTECGNNFWCSFEFRNCTPVKGSLEYFYHNAHGLINIVEWDYKLEYALLAVANWEKFLNHINVIVKRSRPTRVVNVKKDFDSHEIFAVDLIGHRRHKTLMMISTDAGKSNQVWNEVLNMKKVNGSDQIKEFSLFIHAFGSIYHEGELADRILDVFHLINGTKTKTVEKGDPQLERVIERYTSSKRLPAATTIMTKAKEGVQKRLPGNRATTSEPPVKIRPCVINNECSRNKGCDWLTRKCRYILSGGLFYEPGRDVVDVNFALVIPPELNYKDLLGYQVYYAVFGVDMRPHEVH